MDAAGWDHWAVQPHLGSSGHPGVSGDYELAAGLWGARRWIFSLICRGKRICQPGYCCGVLNSAAEIVINSGNSCGMPWAAGDAVCTSVCVSVPAGGLMKHPDTSKTSLLRAEVVP